jgi:hypothetical protein
MDAAWFRSGRTPPPPELARLRLKRRVRNWLRARLPEPDVRDRTMVVYCRRGFRKKTAWPGMFSEVTSVLGALAYAESHGAAAVRVDFRSPHYLDADRGPNWWTYFFDRDLMPIQRDAVGRAAEIHLTSPIAKYGRYGGFCDVVNGETPHLYPMTYGIDRRELHRVLTTHVRVRPEIEEKADGFVASRFDRGACVLGVMYRGTDTARHYPFYRVPYGEFAAEVREALDTIAPRAFQLMVATDETDFVAFMAREFGGRVICWTGSPRVRAGDGGVHFNRTLPVSGYQKGESALIDCMLLSRTDYLVCGRSNISDVALVFNPNLPFSFRMR